MAGQSLKNTSTTGDASDVTHAPQSGTQGWTHAATAGGAAPHAGCPAAAASDGKLAGMPVPVELPLCEIDAGPDRLGRDMDDKSVIRLATSMHKLGQVQPCVVRPHPTGRRRWLLVAGERQFRAASVLGWRELRCVVEPSATIRKGGDL
jgi:hypothetical protein